MRCYWCKRSLDIPSATHDQAATKDHKEPRSRGGHNKVWACRACNNIKANLTVSQWKQFMDANPGWWMLYHEPRIRAEAIRRILNEDTKAEKERPMVPGSQAGASDNLLRLRA